MKMSAVALGAGFDCALIARVHNLNNYFESFCCKILVSLFYLSDLAEKLPVLFLLSLLCFLCFRLLFSVFSRFCLSYLFTNTAMFFPYFVTF